MNALLTLVQWLSPSFPTGAFAYSHGLEAAIASGEVETPADLRQWLSEVLEFGAGRQDAILLAQALSPDGDLDALDALARALQPTAERLAETLDQGTAFARTVSGLTGRNLPPRCLPISVAEAARPLGQAVDQVVGLYLHAFALNLTTVAMRYMPLGQEAGQAVQASLHPLIADLATQASKLHLEDLGSAALGADLASMNHETMEVRIFRT